MRKGYRELWSRLGWVEKTFLFLMVVYVLLRVTGLSSVWQLLAALAAFVFGSIALIRLTYALTRKASIAARDFWKPSRSSDQQVHGRTLWTWRAPVLTRVAGLFSEHWNLNILQPWSPRRT